MQRTYGRRARRLQTTDNGPSSPVPQTNVSDDQSHTPSHPRKRQKVFVEIVSPSHATSTAKKPELTQHRDSAQSPSKTLPPRNIRTYAGSSRSFLVAVPLPGAGPSKNIQDDTDMHESYADLRTRWGVDNSEDDPRPDRHDPATPRHLRRDPTITDLAQPSLPAGMMNDLLSITELRSKGESRRFLDEVGYLFEGLDGCSAMGLRRASALELVSKLCDPDFNRRAKASDFYVSIWDKFSASRAGASDKIFDATVTFFAALAARDPHTLMDVAQRNEFISAIVEILGSLDHKKDVLALVFASGRDADLKAHGILRTEILPLKSLAEVVSKESHLCSTNQPSARFFISHALAALPPSILAVQHLTVLLTSLRTELSLLEPRIMAYESGLQLLPLPNRTNINVPSLYHIEACLRLLDSYLLGQWASLNTDAEWTSPIGLAHADRLASELLSLCVVSSASIRECTSEEDATIGEIDIQDAEVGEIHSSSGRKCLCGALRVLTILSHGDKAWCRASLEDNHALPFVARIAVQSQAKRSEHHVVADVSDSSSLINSVPSFRPSMSRLRTPDELGNFKPKSKGSLSR
ncbi:hypothetical protein BU15DRAFT_74666 [Melanogaster broomeanus]|nr:hypothetical protein BU15DRAFT_74666 [Melanogaster broomeanus]